METLTNHHDAVLYLHSIRTKFERLARRKYFLRAEDARDAVSEALTRVLRWGLGEAKEEEEVVKYFTTVLKRVIWSRAWRRSLPPGFLDDTPREQLVDARCSVDRIYELIDARSLAARILDYINLRAQENINFKTLKLYVELEHLKRKRGNSALNAVARELGATNGAVRERIKRARNELRALFL